MWLVCSCDIPPSLRLAKRDHGPIERKYWTTAMRDEVGRVRWHSGAMKRREPSRLVIGGLGGLESTTRPVRAAQYRLVSLIFLHFRSGSIARARPFLVRNRCVNRGPHAS